MNAQRAAFFLLLSSIAWPSAEADAQAGPPEDPALEHSEVESVLLAPGETFTLQAPARSRVEYAWQGGEWQPAGAQLRAPDTDGDYWLATLSRDEVGIVSDIGWHSVRVDGSGPDLRIAALAASRAGSDGYTTSWLPPGSRAVCRGSDPSGVADLNWSDTLQDGALERALPTETGSVSLRCIGRDRLGNTSATDQMFHIDASAPVLSFATANGKRPVQTANGRWLITATTVVARAYDPGSGVAQISLVIDDRKLPGSRWQATPGRHTLEIRARDHLGHEATYRAELSVDESAPELDVTIESERNARVADATYYIGPVTLRTSASGHDRLDWSDDGIQWRSFSENITTERDWIAIRARDNAGNQTVSKISLPRDATPPAVNLLTGNGGRFEPGTRLEIEVGESLAIDVRDSHSGVSSYSVAHRRTGWPRWAPRQNHSAVDDAMADDPDGRPSVTLDRPGRHIVRVVAVDALGNVRDALWKVIVGARR